MASASALCLLTLLAAFFQQCAVCVDSSSWQQDMFDQLDAMMLAAEAVQESAGGTPVLSQEDLIHSLQRIDRVNYRCNGGQRCIANAASLDSPVVPTMSAQQWAAKCTSQDLGWLRCASSVPSFHLCTLQADLMASCVLPLCSGNMLSGMRSSVQRLQQIPK